MPTFTYGTSTFEYTVREVQSKQDCTISVDWNTGVSVIVPEGTDLLRINNVLKRKAPWILRRMAEFREIKPPSGPHEYISGEKFPYLGRQYRLKVIPVDVASNVSIVFQNGRFIATVQKSSSPSWREAHLGRAFRDWYIDHGLAKVQQRTKLFALRLGVTPSMVVVKDQQVRWGSCTKNGTININWRILMAPMRIVDYVIVHELGHMIHADHSSEFWNVVSSVMPDYDERKEWLRINGPSLEM